MHRIKEKKSNYSVADWDLDENKRSQLLQKLGNYPFALRDIESSIKQSTRKPIQMRNSKSIDKIIVPMIEHYRNKKAKLKTSRLPPMSASNDMEDWQLMDKKIVEINELSYMMSIFEKNKY